MKKVLILLLILTIFMVMLVSCDENNTPIEINPNDTNHMQYIGSSEVSTNGAPINNYGPAEEIQYYLDNQTQIIYVMLVNHGGESSWAGLTPLIDSDGTFTTYEEYLERFNSNQ